jgi:D-serine deaminase-like pyridoxal phosphate-dependent protein
MKLAEIETPCLVLDAGRLDRNLARMRARTDALGVALRPHLKTAKSIDVARRAMRSPAGPITVSTLKEAEYFLEHGVTDILYAVGIAPNKLEHAASLRRRGADVMLILDSADAAQAVCERGRVLGQRFPVLIEIDCDGHRSGIRPGDPALLEVAGTLAAGGAELRGVMTHAGASYDCRGEAAMRAMAEQERAAVVSAAATLRQAGHPAPIVSVGSTPTATFAAGLAGVTEVRAGTYVFYDLVMVGLGVCAVDDIAISVLATVIGHQREKGWLITDAGWMAMSRDRGTAKQPVDQGYGVVCDLRARPIDDLLVTDANQEHGIVSRRSRAAPDFERFPLGTQLRILPNHACATAAQYGAYQVVRGGDEIEGVWPRFNGW